MFPQRSTYRPAPGMNGLGATCNCSAAPMAAIVGNDENYPSPLKIAFACLLAAAVVYGCTKIKI